MGYAVSSRLVGVRAGFRLGDVPRVLVRYFEQLRGHERGQLGSPRSVETYLKPTMEHIPQIMISMPKPNRGKGYI